MANNAVIGVRFAPDPDAAGHINTSNAGMVPIATFPLDAIIVIRCSADSRSAPKPEDTDAVYRVAHDSGPIALRFSFDANALI
jgi:hypothetical protein